MSFNYQQINSKFHGYVEGTAIILEHWLSNFNAKINN